MLLTLAASLRTAAAPSTSSSSSAQLSIATTRIATVRVVRAETETETVTETAEPVTVTVTETETVTVTEVVWASSRSVNDTKLQSLCVHVVVNVFSKVSLATRTQCTVLYTIQLISYLLGSAAASYSPSPSPTHYNGVLNKSKQAA